MKRFIIISLLFFLSTELSISQNIDSLRLLLKTETIDSNKLRLYSELGYFYQRASNYDSAYFFYQKSLILSSELKDTSRIIINQFNIAKVYYWMSFHEKADSLLKESMKLAVLVKDTTSQTHIFTSLGVNSLKMRDTISSLNYYKKALNLCGEDNISEKGNIYANLGHIYYIQEKLDKAIEYFSMSEKMWQKLGNTSNIARIQFEKAKVFYEEGNYRKAIKYYQNSLLLDSINPFKTIQSWKYKRLSEAYLKINKFDSAYYFLEKHYLMQNEIYSKDRINNIKELELKYETQLKDKENINLKLENTLNKQVIKTKDYLFTGSMILLFLVILIIVILYRSYKNIKKSNTILEQQKKEISKQSDKLEKSNLHLLELDQHKQNLTSMLVHDLSNPLHVIKSSTNDINIISIADQIILMIDNLLTIQKFEDKSLNLELFDYQLKYLSDKAINQTQILAKKKNIKLVNKISDKIFIHTDSLLLQRVFVNLISNSIRFTPDNGEIIISAKEIENGKIVIYVSDTGVGIPEDKIKYVFDKYSTSDTDKNSEYKNYGLGLNFCKMAIESMNGTICAKNKEDEGVVFSFSLNGEIKENAKSIDSEQQSINLHEGIEFTDNEKKLLIEHFNNLKELEIYELSEIKLVLNKIALIESENIKNWLVLIENAVYTSNTELFHQLINIK